MELQELTNRISETRSNIEKLTDVVLWMCGADGTPFDGRLRTPDVSPAFLGFEIPQHLLFAALSNERLHQKERLEHLEAKLTVLQERKKTTDAVKSEIQRVSSEEIAEIMGRGMS